MPFKNLMKVTFVITTLVTVTHTQAASIEYTLFIDVLSTTRLTDTHTQTYAEANQLSAAVASLETQDNTFTINTSSPDQVFDDGDLNIFTSFTDETGLFLTNSNDGSAKVKTDSLFNFDNLSVVYKVGLNSGDRNYRYRLYFDEMAFFGLGETTLNTFNAYNGTNENDPQYAQYTIQFQYGLRETIIGDITEDYPTVSPVPVPAAVWLFGSAMIGLVGFSRKKKLQA